MTRKFVKQDKAVIALLKSVDFRFIHTQETWDVLRAEFNRGNVNFDMDRVMPPRNRRVLQSAFIIDENSTSYIRLMDALDMDGSLEICHVLEEAIRYQLNIAKPLKRYVE